jgi:hypothetical protein
MKLIIFILSMTVTAIAGAAQQKDFTIPSDCQKAIETTIINIFVGGDEALMDIVGTKLVYGGVYKGSSYPVVAIVRTSDEVDPRDVLVKTSAPSNGACVVESVEVLADGVLPEDPELDLP